MGKSCCAAAGLPVARLTPAAFALAAMLALWSPADAASIGHSRMVSAPGQPLQIDVPVRDLDQAEQHSLRVSVAPLAAWQQAGLTPPVELSSMQASVEQGFSANSRVIRVRSSEPFSGPVADLLLQVNTAAGSQQHQVSLLANTASSAPAVAGQAGAGGAPAAGTALGAAAPQASIAVRRGDTLFALAQANAVEGVSVYQMMVALLRANPQAFIEGNLNLVKAGATLAIPDAAALRAVSDREARRIFQQHVQAYAAYRQGIAGQRGQAVQGGSAQSGSVSLGGMESTAAVPAAANGDQVVLSSGDATDAAADQRDATQRNIAESQTRVSQLERNVQSLNQALQMQGEAAKDAVLDGAAAVGQTLSDAAASMGVGPDESPTEGAAQNGQTGRGSSAATGQPGVASSGEAGSSAGASSSQAAGASQPDGTSSEASGSAQSGVQSGQAGSQAGGAGSTTAGDADGSLNDTASSPSPQGGQPGQARQDAGAASPASGEQPANGIAGGSPAAAQAGSTGAAQSGAAETTESSTSTSSKADQPVSWLQQNLLGVITAILALVVLIIAWVLRRASAARAGDGQGGVTEAMVQERLQKIDLDLASPPDDGQPPRSA